MHWAARCNNIDYCQQLLEAGADCNIQDKSGSSPLHYAASNGHPEMVFLLLSHGANIMLKDIDNCTPTHSACMILKEMINSKTDSNATQSTNELVSQNKLDTDIRNALMSVITILKRYEKQITKETNDKVMLDTHLNMTHQHQ